MEICLKRAKAFCKKCMQLAGICLFCIIVAVGLISAYVFFKFGQVSFESIFFINPAFWEMEWIRNTIGFGILVSILIASAIYYSCCRKTLIIVAGVALGAFCFVFRFVEYVRYSVVNTSFYEENYDAVYLSEIPAPQEKKNLIIIYLESMEQRYIEEAAPYLAQLQQNNLFFQGFQQIEASDITLTAQYSGLCGLPIKNNVSDNTALFNFAKSVVCIPDILKNAGYETIYIKAADLNFSYASEFATQHSYTIRKGYEELQKELKQLFTPLEGNAFGGMRDKALFAAAKKIISTTRQPFFLTLTTLDMHSTPEYFVDPECSKKFGDVRDAVSCVDKNVKDFMKWMQKQDFYDDTLIVIMGDHINPLSVDEQIYNVFINPSQNKLPHIHQWTTFDLAPTILSAMDFEVDKFALGRSLFEQEKTLFEMYGAGLSFLSLAKNQTYNRIFGNFQTTKKFTPYTLGTALNKDEIVRYIDIGEMPFPHCKMASQISMKINNVGNKDLVLELDFVKANVAFEIKLNSHVVYTSEKDNVLELKQLKINLPNDLIKKDGKLLIEINPEERSRNTRILGVCINRFLLKSN